ncbi:hypothetical protein [Winogradskya humida]|uniref:Uncharacterized protein n=1 Tax=Winogradskya humida TaxID=113566 RepID=A0ABQ3ZVS2_9ACTN|nr:hypothetical protein [Actinoplanes humidus]GIE22684.1 hypothetical protein Ahu01nite_057860 [Actinoplanes humidus]
MTARGGSGALHLQVSKLLVGSIVLAIAATGALVVTLIVGFPQKPGPPPGTPGVMPGPPPDERPVAVLIVLTGLVVLAWLAALIVSARDLVLQRLSLAGEAPTAADPAQIRSLLEEVRTELAADREREWQAITERLLEYADQRETDGYLNGMRVATAGDPIEANVHPLRRPPTQR